MVGASGFEPLTTRTPSVCATRLRYAPTIGLTQAGNLTLQGFQINLRFAALRKIAGDVDDEYH